MTLESIAPHFQHQGRAIAYPLPITHYQLPMTDIPPPLLDRMTREWIEFGTADEIPIAIHPLAAFALISQVQLALRHPQNTGLIARQAEDLARKLQTIFPPDSAIYQVFQLGWSSVFDVEVADESDS